MFPSTLKPSLRRRWTTETTTTASLTHITDEEGSCTNNYAVSQYEDDFDHDDDDDSIDALISSTARRWKQETANTVRHTTTGARFPTTASALQAQPHVLIQEGGYYLSQHQIHSHPTQHHHEQQQRASASAITPVSPFVAPPVAVLSFPHSHVDDDDLTVDTALWTATPCTRRPNHDDTPCR